MKGRTRLPAILRDRRILVAEDEYMIAAEITEILETLGAEALGPVSRVSDALHLIAVEHSIDGAILDVNLHNEAIWPVVDVLMARGVPMVLATGYDASAIPLAYAHLARQEKPTTGAGLSAALAGVLAVTAGG